jgi:hypothetical protein
MMDRQIGSPIPTPFAFVGVESLENALQMRRVDAGAGIAHCHEDTSVLLGADQQFSCPRLNRAHCFNRVQDQVQDDLLQLNAIPLNGNNRSASRVRTETPFLNVRANTIASSIAALI